MIKLPYVVLGNYKLPRSKEPHIVGSELTALTAKFGFEPTTGNATPWEGAEWRDDELKAEVRGPFYYRRSGFKGNWHFDGPSASRGFSEWNCGIIVWSSKSPTQILYEDKIYTPEPFQIILFRNKGPRHRQHGRTKGRWFFRQYVALPIRLEGQLG
jgi:hypothetical protein